jgi:ankyrin repeat protein
MSTTPAKDSLTHEKLKKMLGRLAPGQQIVYRAAFAGKLHALPPALLTEENLTCQLLGITPIAAAAKFGQLKHLPKSLLTAKHLTHPDQDGATALHEAAYHGFLNQVPPEVLTRANLTIRDNTASTPLHDAAHEGHLDQVPAAVLTDTNLNLRRYSGRTVIHVAAYTGHLDQVPPTALTAAQLTIKDNDGNTPLHLAAANGHLDQVPMSVLTPENLTIKNKENRTALEHAQRNGFSDQIPPATRAALAPEEHEVSPHPAPPFFPYQEEDGDAGASAGGCSTLPKGGPDRIRPDDSRVANGARPHALRQKQSILPSLENAVHAVTLTCGESIAAGRDVLPVCCVFEDDGYYEIPRKPGSNFDEFTDLIRLVCLARPVKICVLAVGLGPRLERAEEAAGDENGHAGWIMIYGENSEGRWGKGILPVVCDGSGRQTGLGKCMPGCSPYEDIEVPCLLFRNDHHKKFLRRQTKMAKRVLASRGIRV